MKKEAGKSGRQEAPVAPLVRGKLSPKARGDLGELAFELKAASLGFGVSKPHGDDERYDFIVDSGNRLWKVQVKSSCRPYRTGYAAHGDRGLGKRYKASEIDLLVAYILPRDIWYVIPVKQLTTRLVFYPSGCGGRGGQFECYREAWHLMGARPSGPSSRKV
jgi:PD-(D/E)XK endonuclease